MIPIIRREGVKKQLSFFKSQLQNSSACKIVFPQRWNFAIGPSEIPVYGRFAHFEQKFIRPGKMAASEKSRVCGQWRGMCSAQNKVAGVLSIGRNMFPLI